MDDRKRTDTYPITFTLKANGSGANLIGYTVTINITDRATRVRKVTDGACVPVDASTGRYSYSPGSSLDTSATYDLEAKAVNGSDVKHFPSRGYEALFVGEVLG